MKSNIIPPYRAAIAAALLLVPAALLAQPAPTQPVVDVSCAGANLTTWSNYDTNGWGVTYYVATTGNDSNPGTSSQPFATIDAAVAAAQSQIANYSVQILVSPGTYNGDYFNLNFGNAGNPSAYPISIQANGAGGVVITGSQSYQGNTSFCPGWTKTATAHVYSIPWTENLGYTAVPTDWSTQDSRLAYSVLARQENVYTDGTLLQQRRLPITVDGTTYKDITSIAGLQNNQFCVDDTNQLLYIYDDSNTMTKITTGAYAGYYKSEYDIEITTPPNGASGPFTAVIADTENVRLVGLTFELYPTVWRDGGLELKGDQNLYLSKCTFLLSSSGGAYIGQYTNGDDDVISSCKTTIDSCTFTRNGTTGLFGSNANKMAVTNDTFSSNNRHGAWILYCTWYIAGAKFGTSDTALVKDCLFTDNSCTGLWWDVLSENTSVQDCAFIDNNLLTSGDDQSGYWCEISGQQVASEAPGMELTSCQITGNKMGVYLSNSDNCYVHDNNGGSFSIGSTNYTAEIYNNVTDQMIYRNYNRADGDPVYSGNMWVVNNVIGSNISTSPVPDIVGAVDSAAGLYGECLYNAEIQNNTYYAVNPSGKCFACGTYVPGTPPTGTITYGTFADWQVGVGPTPATDLDSTGSTISDP